MAEARAARNLDVDGAVLSLAVVVLLGGGARAWSTVWTGAWVWAAAPVESEIAAKPSDHGHPPVELSPHPKELAVLEMLCVQHADVMKSTIVIIRVRCHQNSQC